MLKQKRLHEAIPQALEERVKEVIQYPRSTRVANHLFDVGIALVRASNLFVPYFSHMAKIGYTPNRDNSVVGLLTYTRYIPRIADGISAWFITPQENYGVNVLRVFEQHPYEVDVLQVSHGPFGMLGPREWELSMSEGLVGHVIARHHLE